MNQMMMPMMMMARRPPLHPQLPRAAPRLTLHARRR